LQLLPAADNQLLLTAISASLDKYARSHLSADSRGAIISVTIKRIIVAAALSLLRRHDRYGQASSHLA